MPISKRLPLPRASRQPHLETWPTEAPDLPFTSAERRLIARLRTPIAVQRWLNALPYNNERGGETLRSFRGVVRTGTAHCYEAALAAAVVLEQHGYPPLVLSFESIDLLDHVIFVYRHATGWGSVARSRDPGLHGRKPVFRTPRALALSYVDTYIDLTGRITTVAGGNPAGFSGDGGPATSARLYHPRSIAISGRNLYIADSRNNRIRRVDLDTRIINTVAGTGVAGFSGDGGAATAAALSVMKDRYQDWSDSLSADTMPVATKAKSAFMVRSLAVDTCASSAASTSPTGSGSAASLAAASTRRSSSVNPA